MKVFVGWDSREEIAFDVCSHSIARHSGPSVEVIALKQDELRDQGLYSREADPLASTEFTYTRFLVPALMAYEGWAVFCDCDFLFTAGLDELFALAEERYAVLCVHHDYRPTETTKMDGVVQTVYPRKNWSSLVLWNCSHPANRELTPEVVNRETGAFLHRFQWLRDDLIGELPVTWNWLEGWHKVFAEDKPKGIHFTRGGPWFDAWQGVDYAALWLAEKELLETGK